MGNFFVGTHAGLDLSPKRCKNWFGAYLTKHGLGTPINLIFMRSDESRFVKVYNRVDYTLQAAVTYPIRIFQSPVAIKRYRMHFDLYCYRNCYITLIAGQGNFIWFICRNLIRLAF